ncbi:MAG: two-component regulator propeller domain-containing protein [Bacteroidota bacterium]
MTRLLLNWVIAFTLTIGFTSCNGQVKKDLTQKEVVELEIEPSGQSQLKRTQGSREGDNVNCSLQDKAGNLWFGTTGEGVYKFDGKSFKQYTESDGLSSNTVFCIFEDIEGKIWIGTDDGLSVYDGNAITDVHITPPVNSLHNKFYVFSIMQDESGEIWLATVEGVYVYDGKSFTSFTVNEGGSGFISDKNNVEYILEDSAGNFWFGGRVNKGVFRYDGKSIINYELEELAGHDWVWPVLEDNKGNIWFSNWGGVIRYDGKSFKSYTEKDGLMSGAIMRIIEDKDGNLWFGGESGICRYNGKSFTHFTTKNRLINDGVWTLLEDNVGNLWLVTKNMGLYRFDGEKLTNFSEDEPLSPTDR